MQRRRTHSIDKICREPGARRELLWLRAKSKGDEGDARSLIDLDPGIRARLAALYAIDRLEQLDGRERTEAFEALWDTHYARLVARAR